MKKAALKFSTFLSILFLATSLFVGCSDDDSIEIDDDSSIVDDTDTDDDTSTVNDADFEPTDWTSETHSKDADPNFD